MSKRNPICSECGQLDGHYWNCPESPIPQETPMGEQIDAHLTDIIKDVEKVRKAIADEDPHRMTGDAILSKLADVSNALDDLYNEIVGI